MFRDFAACVVEAAIAGGQAPRTVDRCRGRRRPTVRRSATARRESRSVGRRLRGTWRLRRSLPLRGPRSGASNPADTSDHGAAPRRRNSAAQHWPGPQSAPGCRRASGRPGETFGLQRESQHVVEVGHHEMIVGCPFGAADFIEAGVARMRDALGAPGQPVGQDAEIDHFAAAASPSASHRSRIEQRIVGRVADREDEGCLGIRRGETAKVRQHAGQVARAVSRHAREYGARPGRRRSPGSRGDAPDRARCRTDGRPCRTTSPSTRPRVGFAGRPGARRSRLRPAPWPRHDALRQRPCGRPRPRFPGSSRINRRVLARTVSQGRVEELYWPPSTVAFECLFRRACGRHKAPRGSRSRR